MVGNILLVFGVIIVSLSAIAWLSVWGFCLIKMTIETIESIASLFWARVDGSVIYSSIHMETGTQRDPDTGIEETYDIHHPLISYSYEFGNFQYKSDRVSLVDTSIFSPTSRKQAEKIASKYHGGMSVVVYCNPRKPQQSVLEPGLKARTAGFFLLSLTLFSLMVMVIFPFIRDEMS